jgi:hypothetical protein
MTAAQIEKMTLSDITNTLRLLRQAVTDIEEVISKTGLVAAPAYNPSMYRPPMVSNNNTRTDLAIEGNFFGDPEEFLPEVNNLLQTIEDNLAQEEPSDIF